VSVLHLTVVGKGARRRKEASREKGSKEMRREEAGRKEMR